MSITKTYSEPNQTFKVKPFAKTVNSWKLHFIESSISEVWLDFKLPSGSLLKDAKKRVEWRYLRSKRLQVFYEKVYSKHWKGNIYAGLNLSKPCSPPGALFFSKFYKTIPVSFFAEHLPMSASEHLLIHLHDIQEQTFRFGPKKFLSCLFTFAIFNILTDV